MSLHQTPGCCSNWPTVQFSQGVNNTRNDKWNSESLEISENYDLDQKYDIRVQ